MSESTQPPDPPDQDVPHDDDLDLEGPNESAPGHHPDESGDQPASGRGD